jgi:hypothetical protein
MPPHPKVDEQISNAKPWQQKILTEFRSLITSLDSNIVEEFKWSTAVWTINKKLICAATPFKNHVKINFFDGAFLADPDKLLNSGLDAKNHRSIDILESQNLEKNAIKELIFSAVEYAKSK